MSEVSTQLNDTRAVVTDTSRKDVAAKVAQSAIAGQGDGKRLPSMSESRGNAETQSRNVNSQQRVAHAVAKLNDYVQSFQRDLTFTLDEDLGRSIVRVVDSSTQEVIRQIPNEVTLHLARNLKAIEAERLAESYGEAGRSSSTEGASIGLVNTRI